MTHYATYSRSNDCFPANCSDTFIKGFGCHVWSDDGREFIDWGMALRSVMLGYCYPAVDEAVKKAIDKGISFTRSNPYEGELREIICEELKLGETCKFSKNGSDATSNAIRLARAFTGKSYILIPKECPFFSTDSWFIGTTPVNDGILHCEHAFSKIFSYNDMTINGVDLDGWLTYNNDVAAIIVDLSTADNSKEKLQKVRDLCTRHGLLLIMDEIITGFRVGLRGYQGLYNIKPDLTTFAKGLGNGYAISCLAGRKDIFDLGIRGIGDTFCMSGTYFSCVDGLSAALATIKELMEWREFDFMGDSLKPSIITAHDCLNATGNTIISWTKEYINNCGLSDHVSIGGHPTCPMMKWNDLRLKTIFDWKMIEQGILMPYIAPSLSHSKEDIYRTISAIDDAMDYVKYALTGDLDKFIDENCGGHVQKPVFRRT